MAGKSLFTADTLSRAPCSYSVSEGGSKFTDQEVESFADAITDAIPIVQSMLIKFCTAQINDSGMFSHKTILSFWMAFKAIYSG